MAIKNYLSSSSSIEEGMATPNENQEMESATLQEGKQEKNAFDGVTYNINKVKEIMDEAMSQLTEQELEEKRLNEELNGLVVSMQKEYPEEDCLLTVGGVGIAARQDLVCIKAKQKSGKSTLEAILMAATLCGQWGVVKRNAEGLRMLYVDTEMKERDTQLIIRKALHLAGMPLNEDCSTLVPVNLRECSIEESQRRLGQLMEHFSPDIVFVDGIVDLCSNFNDVTTSQELVQLLMTLADSYNCCIVVVLHTNKSLDDHNMRGHLGSFLSQKCSTVIECVKDSETNIVTVKCSESRHAPFEEFYFGFDLEGNIVNADERMACIDREKAARKAADKEAKEAKREEAEKTAVAKIITENRGLASRAYVVNQLDIRNVCKTSQGYKIVNRLLTEGYLSLAPDNKTLVLNASRDAHQTEMTFG